MEGGCVRRGAADDDGDVEFVDELLEVERLGLRGDVLGRDGRAADDEDVDAGIDDGLVELLGPLRGQGTGHGDAGFADLLEAGGDEVGADRLRVELLHPGGRHVTGQLGDLREQGGGILIAGPQAFEVKDAEAAEPAEGDRSVRGHRGVHGSADEGEIEVVGIDLP
ncbi:Uncharacterised protein [Mycobacteroides abscessus subsp. abscessus]|nr:Uncharacterised protein [Mycobacteroides abscessus subsp. abscessus]